MRSARLERDNAMTESDWALITTPKKEDEMATPIEELQAQQNAFQARQADFEKGQGALKKGQAANEKAIAEVKSDANAMKAEQIELRERQAVVEAQYQQVLAILSDIKREIAESRAETKREIAALKSDMKWFFGVIVVLAGLVLAALKLFQ